VYALLYECAHPFHFQQDTVIFGPDKPAEHLVLLVSGTIRVQRLSQTEREVVLYRVHAGESCVLTTACLLAFADRSVRGVAETDIEAILVPRATFEDLMEKSREFRALVFDDYSKRISDLFFVIGEAGLEAMDMHAVYELFGRSRSTDALQFLH
jgi:CRP/FNR family transcriptional regulator